MLLTIDQVILMEQDECLCLYAFPVMECLYMYTFFRLTIIGSYYRLNVSFYSSEIRIFVIYHFIRVSTIKEQNELH